MKPQGGLGMAKRGMRVLCGFILGLTVGSQAQALELEQAEDLSVVFSSKETFEVGDRLSVYSRGSQEQNGPGDTGTLLLTEQKVAHGIVVQVLENNGYKAQLDSRLPKDLSRLRIQKVQ
jgi:hypothetical protein